ncbi:MAG: single-stranded DNA-binding protein [Actinomycetota bacterium]
MAIDNNVTVTGNATREPELRFTPSGQAVANFGIAVNRRWQNRQTQEWEEAVSFFDITAWSQLAENAAETVAKGTRVTVTGRLDQRSWETQDGDKRSKVEIVADDIAVSLRWATAEVIRNERADGGGGFRPSGGGAPAQAPSAPAYNPDEEPF